MLFWCLTLFHLIDVHSKYSTEVGLTPSYYRNLEEIEGVAKFGDGQHRGEKWYDYDSSESSRTDMESDFFTSSSSISSSSISSSSSSEASSIETKERRRNKEFYRACTPCPEEMLKAHDNRGIKWICGAYQRARRSFKSECMMRYRNCQDGTLFIKIYDHRCKNSTYHGKHWFYVYKT